jgi:hypothetical protein
VIYPGVKDQYDYDGLDIGMNGKDKKRVSEVR